MTKEEAIKELQIMPFGYSFDDNEKEAVKMAIEALQSAQCEECKDEI